MANATETPATLVTVLLPEEVFTVNEYPYTRFMFGTDVAYRAKSKLPAPGTPGTPWAFALPAVLSATPLPKEPIAAHLGFGSLVTTPGYGTYRLERDHNRNVKFVEVPQPGTLSKAEVATLVDIVGQYRRNEQPARVTMAWVYGLLANSAVKDDPKLA